MYIIAYHRNHNETPILTYCFLAKSKTHQYYIVSHFIVKRKIIVIVCSNNKYIWFNVPFVMPVCTFLAVATVVKSIVWSNADTSQYLSYLKKKTNTFFYIKRNGDYINVWKTNFTRLHEDWKRTSNRFVQHFRFYEPPRTIKYKIDSNAIYDEPGKYFWDGNAVSAIIIKRCGFAL